MDHTGLGRLRLHVLKPLLCFHISHQFCMEMQTVQLLANLYWWLSLNFKEGRTLWMHMSMYLIQNHKIRNLPKLKVGNTLIIKLYLTCSYFGKALNTIARVSVEHLRRRVFPLSQYKVLSFTECGMNDVMKYSQKKDWILYRKNIYSFKNYNFAPEECIGPHIGTKCIYICR